MPPPARPILALTAALWFVIMRVELGRHVSGSPLAVSDAAIIGHGFCYLLGIHLSTPAEYDKIWKKGRDFVSVSDVTEILDKVTEPANHLLTPVCSSAGQTLADIWDLVFGGFNTYVERKRLTRKKALEDFRDSLDHHVASIPEENLCEPALSVVGPALEASKYYFEEPEIREMFAKLVASCMDTSKTPAIHPSFPDIIRQMSPLDAQNLTYFKADLPIVEYQIQKSENGYVTLCYNVFLENDAVNDTIDDIEKQSQSISSLARLGLIDVSYGTFLTNEHVYDKFKETSYYKGVLQEIQKQKPSWKLLIENGLASLTPLGECFKQICID